MTYRPGDHYVLCDICSFQYYRSECTKTWDNLISCPDCLDNGGRRDVQDYKVRPKSDRQMVRDARPEKAFEPTILGVDTTSIGANTATSGGNVTNDGGSSVTAYGVCWSTSTAPTTSDDKTSDGTGTGEFTSSITGLSASTKYYLRAYATNSAGTAYGPTKEFTTTA